MADTATVVEVISKADFAAAQKEIADLRTRLEAAKEDKVKEQVTVLEKSLASKDEEIKNGKTEIENVRASKKELEKELEKAKADLEASTKKYSEVQAQLDENKKTVVRANRISVLVEKGVEKVEAEKIVDSAVAASDELFAVIVDTHAKLVEAGKAAAAWDFEKKKKDEEKKKKDGKDSAKADEQKLDTATTETEAPLATDAAADEVDSVVAGLADFLSQSLDAKKKK